MPDTPAGDGPDPLRSPLSDGARRVAELTGFTADAAEAYLSFHTGMRWLRPGG